MNLLSLLPTVLQTIGKITGMDIFGKAADALGGSEIPPEKKAELQEALMKHESEMRGFDIEEMKQTVSEAVAEISSPDKFTSRARPFCVYAAGSITGAIAIGMLFGVKLDTGAVATILTPLWGNSIYYINQRSKEKVAAMNGQDNK